MGVGGLVFAYEVNFELFIIYYARAFLSLKKGVLVFAYDVNFEFIIYSARAFLSFKMTPYSLTLTDANRHPSQNVKDDDKNAFLLYVLFLKVLVPKSLEN